MPKQKKGELPSGNIRHRLYIGKDKDGKRQYMSFTAPTMKAARQKAAEWKASHGMLSADNPTFSEAAAAFIRNRSETLSPSTIKEYNRILKRLESLYPMFCKKRISVIVSEDVQELVNDFSRRKNENVMSRAGTYSQDKKVSPKTVLNHYAFVRDVLTTQGITLQNIALPKKKNIPLNIPENEVVQKLLQEIAGTELEIPVLLAAFGPMRRGEICALKIENIDFETGTVHVCDNMVENADRIYVHKAPKTAAGERFITYPIEVTNKIKQRGYVTKWSPNVLSRQFVRKLDKLGMQHYRFHDLRHFSASFQIALGIPPEYIMERGGWNTGHTMARYIHALDAQKRTIAQKTNTAFSELL